MLGIPLLKVLGVTNALTAIALGFVMFRADAISSERDALQDWQNDIVAATRLAADRPKLAVKNVALQISYLGNGVSKLKAKITELNRDALDRAEAFDRSKKAASREIALLNKAAQSSDKRIARLLHLAQQSSSSCEIPPELMRELEGL